MRVFIVDDSPQLRARVRDVVAAIPGASVVGEAADAVGAVAGVSRTQPDLVVLDVVMPNGGGRAALDVIRRDTPRPTVIILTNHPEPEYREHFQRHGAAGFFDKSLEFEQFAAAVHALAHGPGRP